MRKEEIYWKLRKQRKQRIWEFSWGLVKRMWFCFIVCPMEKWERCRWDIKNSFHCPSSHSKNMQKKYWMKCKVDENMKKKPRRSWMLISYSWRSHISLNINGYEGWHSTHISSLPQGLSARAVLERVEQKNIIKLMEEES